MQALEDVLMEYTDAPELVLMRWGASPCAQDTAPAHMDVTARHVLMTRNNEFRKTEASREERDVPAPPGSQRSVQGLIRGFLLW